MMYRETAKRQNFEHAVAENLFAFFGVFFHDGEHEFLLAKAARVVDFQAGSHF